MTCVVGDCNGYLAAIVTWYGALFLAFGVGEASGADVWCRNFIAGQDVAHGRRTVIRQFLVDGPCAGAVGVADDDNAVWVGAALGGAGESHREIGQFCCRIRFQRGFTRFEQFIGRQWD